MYSSLASSVGPSSRPTRWSRTSGVPPTRSRTVGYSRATAVAYSRASASDVRRRRAGRTRPRSCTRRRSGRRRAGRPRSGAPSREAVQAHDEHLGGERSVEGAAEEEWARRGRRRSGSRAGRCSGRRPAGVTRKAEPSGPPVEPGNPAGPAPGQLAEDPGRGEELREGERDGRAREPDLQVDGVAEEEVEVAAALVELPRRRGSRPRSETTAKPASGDEQPGAGAGRGRARVGRRRHLSAGSAGAR